MIPGLGQKFRLAKSDHSFDFEKPGGAASYIEFESLCFGTYAISDPGIYFIEEYHAPTPSIILGIGKKMTITDRQIDDWIIAEKRGTSQFKSVPEAKLRSMLGTYYRYSLNRLIEPYIISIEGASIGSSIAYGTSCSVCHKDCPDAIVRPNFICWECSHGPYAGIKP